MTCSTTSLQVEQHPLAVALAFDAVGPEAGFLAALHDAVGDRTHVTVRRAARDDHRVGDVGEPAHVERRDVDGLHVLERVEHDVAQRRRRRVRCVRLGGRRRLACRVAWRRASPSWQVCALRASCSRGGLGLARRCVVDFVHALLPCSPRGLVGITTGLPDDVADRDRASGTGDRDPTAMMLRRSVDEISSCVTGWMKMRPASALVQIVDASGAAIDQQLAERAHCVGARQPGRCATTTCASCRISRH